MRKKTLFLILLILASAYLRIFHRFDWFFWHVDEDIFALTAKKILIDHHPQLLGYGIPGGIYNGPLFYYLTSLAYLISKTDPFGISLIAFFLFLITLYLVYKVGSIIFEQDRVGIFAAIIYGFSFLVGVYSHIYNPLTYAPILALVTYLIIYLNLKSKKPSLLILLGLVLVVSTQMEGTSLSLIVLVVLIFIIYRLRIPRDKILIILSLFIVFHLPLVLFDLRHNFFLTKSTVHFFTNIATRGNINFNFDHFISSFEIFPNTLSRILVISGPLNISSQILPCKELVHERTSTITIYSFMSALIIIAFFILSVIFQKKRTYGEIIILLHLAVLTFGLIIFNILLPGYIHEWLMVIFFPAFAFIMAYLLSKMYTLGLWKYLAIFIAGLFIIQNIYVTLNAKEKYGLSNKVEAVKYAIDKIDGRSFSLDTLGSCYSTGYLYLFWYYGKLPERSYADDIFSSLLTVNKKTHPDLDVIIVNKSEEESNSFYEKYNQYEKTAIEREKIGEAEVLIVEHKNLLR